MYGSGFSDYVDGKKHGYVQLLVLAIVIVSLILLISLMIMVGKKVERFTAKKRMIQALQRSASTTPFNTEVERMSIEQSDRARIVNSLQGRLGSEHLTSVQKNALLARLQGKTGAEAMSPQKADLIARLQGRSESFINHMPMLGGGALTPGAIALRAADPIASEPISPSQKQYMKENELLEHLLYK